MPRFSKKAILEELTEFFTMINHTRNVLFGVPSRVNQRIQADRQSLFNQHAQHAQGMTTQSERILFPRRHLTDTEQANQGFQLVSQSGR